MRTILAAALATLTVATGCSDQPTAQADTDPTAVPTIAQTSTAPSSEEDLGEIVEAYMQALSALDDPDEMRDGLKNAAPNSVAWAYLTHRANIAESALDGGYSISRDKLTREGDGYEVCSSDGQSDSDCSTFTGFKSDGGLVSDLLVDGEEPGPRLTVGNGDKVKSAGVTLEFLSAYRAINGNDLWVTARVKAGNDPVDMYIYSATYRAPDGKQRNVTEAVGPMEFGADSHSVVTLVFVGSKPGGKVTLAGSDRNYSYDIKLVFNVG